MSTRTVVSAVAALMVLGGVALAGQQQAAEPPIRQIDHVMIKANDPHEVFAFFTDTLGLPIAWPLEERGGVVFLSDYSPTYVDVAGRRARIGKELAASGGGPLGVDSMREVVVGASDVETMRGRWQQLLSPARPIRGAWQVGAGPAIRTVLAKENRVEELVVRVRSLTRAKAFLRGNGLLAAETAADVVLDPLRAFGIRIRFVE